MTSLSLRLSSFFVSALTAGALISFVDAADGELEVGQPSGTSRRLSQHVFPTV